MSWTRGEASRKDVSPTQCRKASPSPLRNQFALGLRGQKHGGLRWTLPTASPVAQRTVLSSCLYHSPFLGGRIWFPKDFLWPLCLPSKKTGSIGDWQALSYSGDLDLTTNEIDEQMHRLPSGLWKFCHVLHCKQDLVFCLPIPFPDSWPRSCSPLPVHWIILFMVSFKIHPLSSASESLVPLPHNGPIKNKTPEMYLSLCCAGMWDSHPQTMTRDQPKCQWQTCILVPTSSGIT